MWAGLEDKLVQIRETVSNRSKFVFQLTCDQTVQRTENGQDDEIKDYKG